MRFKNQVVLVTGSSRGIGREIARRFAQEGARVVVNCDRSITDGKMVVKEIRSQGGEAAFVKADVTKEREVRQMIKQIGRLYGGVDILVNNAGFAKQNQFSNLMVSDFQKTLSVNLIGTFLCSRYVAADMIKRKRGVIINIASIRGLEVCARRDIMDYSAAKAGVIALTIAMAKELAHFGIRVNAVAPGITKTELVQQLTPTARRRAVAGSLFKRMAEPGEIAGPVLFLASGEASYVVGHVFIVDGGYRLTEL